MNARELLLLDLPVVATAVVFAVPAALLGPVLVGVHDPAVGFLLLLVVGVFVPQLYERRDRDDSIPVAVAWTVLASIVLAAGYLAVFVLLRGLLGVTPAAAVAFLAASLGPLLAAGVLAGDTADPRERP